MNTWKLLSAVSLVTTIFSTRLDALCISYTPEEQFKAASAVFAATVRKVEYLDPEPAARRRIRVSLEVLEVWKGTVEKQQTVYSQYWGGLAENLKWEPFLGKTMLIFANRVKAETVNAGDRDPNDLPSQQVILVAGHCTVFPYEDGEDLRYLSSLGTGKKLQ